MNGVDKKKERKKRTGHKARRKRNKTDKKETGIKRILDTLTWIRKNPHVNKKELRQRRGQKSKEYMGDVE